MKQVTILVPSYNEQDSLPSLFERLNNLARENDGYDFEFLFINDGSHDKTLELIKKEQVKNKAVSYIDLSRNFGKELAMMAGIDYVKSDALVIIDADLQDPPELIPEMIKLWEEGFDDVYARRRTRSGESALKKLTSSLYYRILQKSTQVPIQQDTGDFRLLDRKCINALQEVREINRNTKALFSWVGYKKKEILYDRDARVSGETKWNYLKLINLAIDGITSFTTAPLRLATVFGFLVSIGAFLYILIIIIRTLFLGVDEPGYPSLMSIILLLGGIQLISLGIIGEYISRIFTETKKRPPYLISEVKRGKNKQ